MKENLQHEERTTWYQVYCCPACGRRYDNGKPALSPVRSDDLFDVLVAIVNTAQLNPDRCMADVCNDNFAVRGINLRAEMTDDEDNPVRIEKTSNANNHDAPEARPSPERPN